MKTLVEFHDGGAIIVDHNESYFPSTYNGKKVVCTTGASSTEEELRQALLLSDTPCKECGGIVSMTGKDGACNWCNFWLEKLSPQYDVQRCAVINGKHYTIAPEYGTSPYSDFRGCAGRQFTIRFHDGRTVTTTNLWSQGEIPQHFRSRFPDNAQFI